MEMYANDIVNAKITTNKYVIRGKQTGDEWAKHLFKDKSKNRLASSTQWLRKCSYYTDDTNINYLNSGDDANIDILNLADIQEIFGSFAYSAYNVNFVINWDVAYLLLKLQQCKKR